MTVGKILHDIHDQRATAKRQNCKALQWVDKP